MYSTLDNDHRSVNSFRRIDSASKRTNANRIQVVSKINNPAQTFNQTTSVQLSQIVTDKNLKLIMNKVPQLTVNANNEKEQNLMKFIQEQLEIGRKCFEDKMKEQQKQISVQMSRLKIKIQNNNELLALKDRTIEELKVELVKPAKQDYQQQIITKTITKRLNDLQNKSTQISFIQSGPTTQITKISNKIERLEKGLLSLFAVKLRKASLKLQKFIDESTKKMNAIQNNFQQFFTPKQLQSPIKNQPTALHLKNSYEQMCKKLQFLQQQMTNLKSKEFRYENSCVNSLKIDFNNLKDAVTSIEKRIHQNHLKNSRAQPFTNPLNSPVKNWDNQKRIGSNSSCLFEDYREQFGEVEIFEQDQFFHPQVCHPIKESLNPTLSFSDFRSSSRPTHNDSFENFTSDEEDDSESQRHLYQYLKIQQLKLPLLVEIDLAGFLRKKSDQTYLFDQRNKKFMLNSEQMTRCRIKGWINW